MENKRFNPFGKFQQKADNAIDPIYHLDPENPIIDPLIMIEDHPNDDDHFAILKTTENGKYVHAGLLQFDFMGINITTEINNVIFVDRTRKAIFIKNYDKVTEEIKPVDPETRQYIIMYTGCDEYGDDIHKWEAMQGRKQTYEWIQDNIDDLEIDPENSYVLVETVPYKDALTITQFVKYLQNAGLVDESDSFDIDNYI